MLIDLLRFVIALPFFLYASYTDLKERLISSSVWFFLGSFAIGFDIYQFFNIESIIAIIPAIIIFYEWFFDWDKKIILYLLYGIAGAIFIYSLIYIYEVFPILLIIILMVFFRILHGAKIIRGKADVRALMTVSLLQPLYPHFSPFPIFVPMYEEIIQLTFPFAFLVLLYSAIASLFLLLFIFLRNLIRRDLGFPEMFIGYKIDVDNVDKKHVWLMQRIENEEDVLYVHPREHKNEDIGKLKKMGRKKVWVQPKIPFVLFITIGLILSYLIGNFI